MGTHNRHDRNGPCHGPIGRRDFLRVGVVSGLGLTLGDYFRLQAAQAEAPSPAAPPPAESVIFVFMAGGMSQLETFDPKPYAPIEYRGELGQAKTSTGEIFGGKFGNLAKVADRLTVVRSLTHAEAAHERGTHNMLTGYRPSAALQYPSMGSVVSHEFGSRKDLPPYICIPSADDPYLGTGFLSSAYGPFSVGGEPNDTQFQVRDLHLPDGITPDRMARRRSLLSEVDAHFAALEQSDVLDAMDSYYQRAYDLISSQNAREAFHIAAEPDDIRNEYGRNPFGQRMLLARRLVEGGARFVTVIDGGWDHHERIKAAMEGKLPPVDQGVATLIRDLDRRGSLEKTLVVLTTEFGRTVRINNKGGRDHWPKAFSVMLAGGGVKRGYIHGATDARGAEPIDHPVSPEDLAATIFTQIGIDPAKTILTAAKRPVRIVRGGNVLRDVIA